jgi:hypothetical protein
MLAKSPYRIRRDVLDELWGDQEKGPGLAHTYWGPVKFRSTFTHDRHDEARKASDELPSSFPKFARARAKAWVTAQPRMTEDGDEYTAYIVAVEIPVRCRVAVFFEDLDYTSPVWFPLLASTILLLRPWDL